MVVGMVLGIAVVKLLGDDPRREMERLLSRGGDDKDHTREVEKVIDGDTLVLQGGERVRFVGVDAPEAGEPLYEEAREFQEKVLLGRRARVEPCKEEPRDDYGRTLAFVHKDDLDVGAQLLRYGLARTLFVGPCGRAVARDYRKAEREAFRGGRGIWSLQEPRRVPHDGAGRYVGCLMSVTGKVANVHAGAKAFHLNFGKDYRTDFTVVLFRKDLARLLGEGLQPVTAYKGRDVEVTGMLREYNGPEIIVEAADQIVLQEQAP
jgi:endonuclease YncB( thermonuclease family)